MLNRTYVSDSSKEVGKEITVYGWVNSTRDHGNLIFFDLRDMTGLLQVVVNKESAPEAHKAASKLSSEDVLQVTGVIKNRAEKYINSKTSKPIHKEHGPGKDVVDLRYEANDKLDKFIRLKGQKTLTGVTTNVESAYFVEIGNKFYYFAREITPPHWHVKITSR